MHQTFPPSLPQQQQQHQLGQLTQQDGCRSCCAMHSSMMEHTWRCAWGNSSCWGDQKVMSFKRRDRQIERVVGCFKLTLILLLEQAAYLSQPPVVRRPLTAASVAWPAAVACLLSSRACCQHTGPGCAPLKITAACCYSFVVSTVIEVCGCLHMHTTHVTRASCCARIGLDPGESWVKVAA